MNVIMYMWPVITLWFSLMYCTQYRVQYYYDIKINTDLHNFFSQTK